MVFASLASALFVVSLQEPDSRPLLALTPVLNGSLFDEEWLSLPAQGGAKGFLQWEPGVIYFAGSADKGDDLIVSLDRNGDGWLVGKDNFEFRVSFVDGKGSLVARALDGTKRDGPAWITRSSDDVNAVFGTSGDRWFVEASLKGSASLGSPLGAGMESLSARAGTGPAYLPRTMNFFRLSLDAAEGLPEAGIFKTSTRLREVAREDSLAVEFEVEEGGAYSTSETRGEGFARSSLSVVTRAFPPVDTKGRTRVSYQSAIEKDAMTGWRVLRSTLVDTKGNKTLLRTSFFVSELIVFDVSLPEILEYSEAAQIVNGSMSVRSTGVGRIEGEFFTNAPVGWVVEKGAAQKLLIYNPRGREKINLRMTIPAKANGSQNLTFTVVVGDQVYTKSVIIQIGK